MAEIKRVVSTAFWTDNKIGKNFTSEDMLFFLYLLTNPYTTQIGIYELPIELTAAHLKISIDKVMELIQRFEKLHKVIRYSEDTGEIAIKNYLRHEIIKGGKPVLDCLKRDMSRVKDMSLLEYVISNLNHNRNGLNKTVIEFLDYVGGKQMDEFIPPTKEEVIMYCKQIHSKTDPELFFEYYDSRRWKINGKPVSDWKLKVREWDSRKKEVKSKNKFNNFHQREYDMEKLERQMLGCDDMDGSYSG